jgi:DNA repair exonuclease SbcCD ATPase subunit
VSDEIGLRGVPRLPSLIIHRGSGPEAKTKVSKRRQTAYNFTKQAIDQIYTKDADYPDPDASVVSTATPVNQQTATNTTVVPDKEEPSTTDRTVVLDLPSYENLPSAFFSYVFEPNFEGKAEMVRDEEIQRLNTALEEKQQTIIDFDEHINKLTLLLATSEAALCEKIDAIAEMEKEMDRLTREKSDALADRDVEVSRLGEVAKQATMEELVHFSETVSLMKSELLAKQEEISALQRLVSAAQSAADAYQANISGLVSEVNQLRHDSSAQEAILSQLQKVVGSVRVFDDIASITGAPAKKAPASQRYQDLVSKVTAMQTASGGSESIEVSSLKAALINFQTELKSKALESQQKADSIAALREELLVAQGELNSTRQVMASMQKKYNGSLELSSALMAELDQAKAAAASSQGVIDISGATIIQANSANPAVIGLTAELNKHGGMMATLTNTIRAASSAAGDEVQRLRAQLQSKDDEIKKLMTTITEHRSIGNANSAQELAALQSKHDALRNEYEQICRHFQARTEESAALAGRLQQLEQATMTANLEKGQIMSDNSRKEQEIGRLNHLLAEVDAGRAKNQQQINQLTREIEKKNSQIAALQAGRSATSSMDEHDGDLQQKDIEISRLRRNIATLESQQGKLNTELADKYIQIQQLNDVIHSSRNTPRTYSSDADDGRQASRMSPMSSPYRNSGGRSTENSHSLAARAAFAAASDGTAGNAGYMVPAADPEPHAQAFGNPAGAAFMPEVLADLRQRQYEENIKKRSNKQPQQSGVGTPDRNDTTGASNWFTPASYGTPPESPRSDVGAGNNSAEDLRQWQYQTNLKRLQPTATQSKK